jgi:tetratricopeptide (TPR) repeat protein
VTLYRFLALLIRAASKDPGAARLAFWGAMLFAVHPVAVYGAGYLIERSIVMAALFSLLAMHIFLRGLTDEKPHYLFLAPLFYFLAVFSKEHAVMLPAVIVSMTLLVRRPSVALLREMLLPLLLLFLVTALIVLKSKGILGQVYEPYALEMLAAKAENQPGFQIENAYPLSILMEGGLFFKYIWLWLLPYVGWMSIDLRVTFPTGFLSWPYTFGFLAFLAYPFFAVKLLLRGGKSGLAGFALLFPWLMFLTEFSAVRIQEPFVLYRSYLWILALPAILPVVVGKLTSRHMNIALGLVVLLLSVFAWNRLDSFSDELKLWDDVVAKNNDKMPRAERGYLNRGRIKSSRRQHKEALQDYDKAILLNPQYYLAYANRATKYITLNRNEEALKDLSRAIEIKPDYSRPYINRGVLKSESGKYREAIEDFDLALTKKDLTTRNRAMIFNNRGVAYMNLGDNSGALKDYDAAIKLDASNALAVSNREVVLKRINNL